MTGSPNERHDWADGVGAIRAARHDDLDAVLELWRDADAEPTHTDDAAGVATLLGRDAEALLLAHDGAELVGSVIAGFDGWRGAVYRLVVAPSHRRRGLARVLLAAAEARLDAVGARRGAAIVVADDEPATAFWDASGWNRQANRARYVRG